MRKNFFLVIAFMITFSAYTVPSPLTRISHEICSKLFGSKKADPAIVAHVQKIRKEYGIENVTAPVNIMDTTSPWRNTMFSLFGSPSCFTWFGTWINKEMWKQMDQNSQTYNLYHEIGHEYLKHPAKQISLFTGSVASITFFCTKITPYFLKSFFFKGLTNIGVIALGLLLIPTYARLCEKQADRVAVQKLLQTDQSSLVEKQLDRLYEHQQDGINGLGPWFPTINEQIENIENATK